MTDTWTNYAGAVFKANCSGCHSFVNSYAGVQGLASTVEGKLAADAMPPRVGLPSSTQHRLLDWLACGAPQ